MRLASHRVILLAAALVLPAGALCQTNEQANSGIQFNFGSPGARSLALGGAFVGLADDATAAYANPSGLVQIKDPEVSLEVSRNEYTSTTPDRGHAFGPPTGVGQDTVAGLHDDDAEEALAGISFVSFVLPRESWAFAVYGKEHASFESRSVSQGPFFEGSTGTIRVPPATTSLDLEIQAFGASFAYRATDRLYLGAGVALYDYSLSSASVMYETVGGTFGPPDFARVNHSHSQRGDDTDIELNVGLLFKPSRRWAVGAVYRRGPSFDTEARNHDAAGAPVESFAGTFHVPDVYGLGVAWNPTDSIRLAAEYDLVRYSQLADDFVVSELHVETQATGIPRASDYEVDDAHQIHAGFEYLLLWRRPLALRLGVWLDPDHSIRYAGPVSIERLLFREGDDEIHIAAGAGIVLGRLKLDAALDVSDRVDSASLSAVLSF